MLSPSLQNAINQQINHEFSSAYLYLSMSAWFESHNLPGFAHWMRAQFNEEQGHAAKFIAYLHDRGNKVELKAIEQPAAEWDSPLAVFHAVLAHEKKVTALIHNLYETSIKESDFAAQIFLQWFVTEQVEEEKNDLQVIEQLKMIDARGTAVLFLDKALAKRGAA